jgi:preprotein translocase SecE subunit
MNKLGKYVNALFLVGAALVWLISQHYLGVAIGYFQLGRKIGVGADVVQHVLPLVFAVVTFIALRGNQAAYAFTSESMDELTKVSWPTQKDVRVGTIVVIVTVLLAGVILGLLDLAFTAIVRTLMGA